MLDRSAPQPFQFAEEVRLLKGALLAQTLGIFRASPFSVAPGFRPPTHSAMSRFCWSVRPSAILTISPAVRAWYILSGVICLRMAGGGALSTLGLPWQVSQ